MLMYIVMSWTTVAASDFKVMVKSEYNFYEQPAFEFAYCSDYFSESKSSNNLIIGGGYSTSRLFGGANNNDHMLKVDKYYVFVGLWGQKNKKNKKNSSQGASNMFSGFADMFIKSFSSYAKIRVGYAGFEVEDSEFSFLQNEFLMLDLIGGGNVSVFVPNFIINLEMGYSLSQNSITLPFTFGFGAGYVF